MIPEERLLWSAIIAQAVKDARGESSTNTGSLPWPEYDAKSEALAWIFGDDTGFEAACDFADTHPEWVRRMVFATPCRLPRRAAGGWKARKACLPSPDISMPTALAA
ncbi:hypothetical protein [Paramagnetospirillum magneticum]|uniref:Uncharacterized protein n=1 Tax=Paramagnetospirillum magneticum (strain ATCC 700264 / AMB-1) TaxID=342108 RepID=Q2VYL1_PARM1|nr:hypothetical protein [Paramagnetospirillum magneticum]BAE53314.1 hypothetical protein amb4510 [Paramagnetospirillum magneticum AMB-1]